jgi:feruloyl esterase
VIVSIRGTASDQNRMLDLRTSLTAEGVYPDCTTCRVHAGFYLGFKEVSNEIEQSIATELQNYPHYQLVFTGHSLGGALAAMLV